MYNFAVKEKLVGVAELRQNLRELMAEVEKEGTRVIAVRHKRAVLALVPIKDYERWQTKEPKGVNTMYRIVFSNISGGEGKSTLTRELAFSLSRRGYRVGVIDTDPQASLTKTLGLHDEPDGPGTKAEHSILAAFETDPPRLPPPLEVNGIDAWPSSDALLRIDPMLSADLSLQGNLREAVDALEGQYDFILLDTKPGITPLLNAAVAAADDIVVPISGDKGMENLDKLARLMKVAKGFSKQIKVTLFVRNRATSTVLSRAVSDDLTQYSSMAPISHPLRESVAVGEASRLRIPLVEYNTRSAIVEDLRQVTDDLLKALGESL